MSKSVGDAACRSRVDELHSASWPAEDLETVSRCPVCNQADRTLFYDDLWDNSALSAPGQWSLWRCANCGSAYLDPRPTAESIGRAYESYYTHGEQPVPSTQGHGGSVKRLKLRLANGYRNWRFGTDSADTSRLGAYLGALLPSLRRSSDFWYRYLPKVAHENPKVLDVGCGGGQWLSSINLTKWEAFGSDPDPRAVALAQRNGLDVRQGGIEAWNDAEGEFDAVTISHVIEHVHDPRDLLVKAFRLLRPGGHLYVETPNIDALGHSFFGRAWRGLEAPRHLVLFTPTSLKRLLRDAGFRRVRQELAPSQFEFISVVSNGLRRIDPKYAGHGKEPGAWMRIRSRWTRSRREFLTFTCVRPPALFHFTSG